MKKIGFRVRSDLVNHNQTRPDPCDHVWVDQWGTCIHTHTAFDRTLNGAWPPWETNLERESKEIAISLHHSPPAQDMVSAHDFTPGKKGTPADLTCISWEDFGAPPPPLSRPHNHPLPPPSFCFHLQTLGILYLWPLWFYQNIALHPSLSIVLIDLYTWSRELMLTIHPVFGSINWRNFFSNREKRDFIN